MASLARFWNSEKSVKFFKIWWTRGDSNPRPPRCERGALPAELLAHEQQINFSKHAGACQHAFQCVQTRKGAKYSGRPSEQNRNSFNSLSASLTLPPVHSPTPVSAGKSTSSR